MRTFEKNYFIRRALLQLYELLSLPDFLVCTSSWIPVSYTKKNSHENYNQKSEESTLRLENLEIHPLLLITQVTSRNFILGSSHIGGVSWSVMNNLVLSLHHIKS